MRKDLSLNTIVHDLRGPLINIKGFASELEHVASIMDRLLREEPQNGSERLRQDLAEILESDIYVCVNCLTIAIRQMDERLSQLADSRNSTS